MTGLSLDTPLLFGLGGTIASTMELADCPECASLREELNLPLAAASILSDQLKALTGTDQHEALLTMASLCRDARSKCALLRYQQEWHEASHTQPIKLA
jgi:hypothetical protein